jgi:Na+/H+ antiporter NhaD/arsenite permease-like protein
MVLPFYIPICVPYGLCEAISRASIACKITSQPPRRPRNEVSDQNPGKQRFNRLKFPINFVTAPLLGCLLLLCISAIGVKELRDGTLGRDDIYPIDIMTLSLLVSYMGLSIEASGLLRYLSLKTLQWRGGLGHRLFFYIYLLSFALSIFLGNEPVVLAMTPLLIGMYRISRNLVNPRAWIYSQLAVANIGASMVVSSSTTNLILVETFKIKFIYYTANMAVPVSISAAILFPCLLYVIFADEKLLPKEFELRNLNEELRSSVPINPILRIVEDEEALDRQLTISEGYLDHFLDRVSAWIGSVILVATIITLLVFDATGVSNGQHTVFWVALPGSFIVFCWDTYHGWHQRHLTRDIIIMRAKASSRVATYLSRVLSKPPVRKSLYSEVTGGEFSYLQRISRASTEPQNRNTRAHGKVSLLPIRRSSDPDLSTYSGTSVDRVSNWWQIQKEASLQSSTFNLVDWLQATVPTTMAVLATMPFETIPFTSR